MVMLRYLFVLTFVFKAWSIIIQLSSSTSLHGPSIASTTQNPVLWSASTPTTISRSLGVILSFIN